MTASDLTNRASALARMWQGNPGSGRHVSAARRLSRVVADGEGLDFVVDLLDRVGRPEDPAAAADALASLELPGSRYLGPADRWLLRAGQAGAPYVPKLSVAAARARMRAMVGHLVIDDDEQTLVRHIAATLSAGYRLDLHLLGEPALGERMARSRMERARELLERPDVDYVSFNVSSLVSQVSPWDLAGTVERAYERLHPVFARASETSPQKFINLDTGAYRDLAPTLEVFQRLLAAPEFMHLSAGITLQAYLPESNEALARLIDFATRRCQAGGAPIKIRLVKGGNLAMERVDAETHGWTPAPYPTKQDVDGNYLRLIDAVLRPDVAYAVRLGVASHNLFHIAYAHLRATDLGLGAALDVEMLHGVAPGAARAVQAEVANPVVLTTPVVLNTVRPRGTLGAAAPYLVRRLHEIAGDGHYLHDQFAGRLDEHEAAFLAATTHRPPATPRRSHVPDPAGPDFVNTSAADPALAATRSAARAALADSPPSLTIPNCDAEGVDDVVERATQAQGPWGALAGQERAEVLRAVAEELSERRFDLITVLAREAGMPIGECDREVCETIDLARYYAEQALELADLEAQDGLSFTPDRVVLVASHWTSPLATSIGGVLAALAAGSAAVLKPHPHAHVCAQVGMSAVHAALAAHGHESATAQLIQVEAGETGHRLVAHPDVDAVILAGTFATARLFTSWRVQRERGARVFAEAPGRNAVIVTPSADYDQALSDVVASAFAHAGQYREAASLLILVGSAGTSPTVLSRLRDAVESLTVDRATELSAQVGPLIRPAEGELRRVLTSLGEGESWLVEPRQLDENGQLWRPGVKLGVRPGSEAHLAPHPVPVLRVMAADSLAQAVEWQNATEYGLAGAIHSLNPTEIDEWAGSVDVGNAYVNRPTTGAVAGRRPCGGWKNSSAGPGAKAGGPNYLAQLGAWSQIESPTALGEIGPRVGGFLDACAPWLDDTQRGWLRDSARSDANARDSYRTPVDRSGLSSESNLLRYRPGPRMTIRAGENTSLVEVLRVVASALAAGVEAGVSVAPELFAELPAEVRRAWKELDGAGEGPAPAVEGVPSGVDLDGPPAIGAAREVAGWRVETLGEFTTRASTWVQPGRIRALDRAEVPAITEAVSTSVAVLPGPALQSGRRELLTFLREQTVSRARHRFGHVGRLT